MRRSETNEVFSPGADGLALKVGSGENKSIYFATDSGGNPGKSTWESNNGNYFGLQAPTDLGGNVDLIWPINPPAANDYMVVGPSGQLYYKSSERLINQYSQDSGQVFAIGGNQQTVIYNLADFENVPGFYDVLTGNFSTLKPRKIQISAKIALNAANTLQASAYFLRVRKDTAIVKEIAAGGALTAGDRVNLISSPVIIDMLPGETWDITVFSGQNHNVINLVAPADATINTLSFEEVG